MAEFDVDAFIARFQDRADAVKERGIPPLEGEARRSFIGQAELDHTDYALVASATWSVEGGHLLLSIPLAGAGG